MSAGLKKRSWILGLVVGIPVFGLVLPMCGLIVFDLVRPLAMETASMTPQSEGLDIRDTITTASSTLSTSPTLRGNPAPVAKHQQTSATAGQTSATAGSNAALHVHMRQCGMEEIQFVARQVTSESLALKQDPLFFGNTPVPTPARELVHRVNAQYEDVVRALRDYTQTERWRNFEEAQSQLMEIEKAFSQFERDFEKVYIFEMSAKQRKNALDRYYRLRTDVLVSRNSLCLMHGRWREWAEFIRHSKLPEWSIINLPSVSQSDRRRNARQMWEMELFALRQLGPEGNGEIEIARRSFERNWRALWRSLYSIGGRFERPHHEEGD